jgi:hypothetical protein
MLSEFFQPAPRVRPFLNCGCLFDIPTGRYLKGKHGEYILNGGLSYITGIGGRGNMFKSVIANFMILRPMDRLQRTMGQFHDTETSLTANRVYQLAQHMPNIGGVDLESEGRLLVSDNTSMSGNEWFDKTRDMGLAKAKDYKKYTMTTPFIDEKTGKFIETLIPTFSLCDSFSMMVTDSVEKIYDENQIGDSGANTDSMRLSAAKSQMLMQLPSVTGKANIYMVLTAHVGDDIPLDPKAPPARKLTFLKGKAKFKHVPEKFTFLTNNLWYATASAPLINDGTKAPEFPRNTDDNLKGDTDLMIITLQNLRAKNGPTGMPFQVIVSQREGVQVGLTEFFYIRSFDRYGLEGNVQNYQLALVPDVNLSRTTVRGKIETNVKLQRALEIMSEMCQMDQIGFQAEGMTEEASRKLICTPKQLYDDLKAKGYDWDRLLDTRGYWVFEEDAGGEKPFLSTLDLLRMRVDEYRPWWYDGDDSATVVKKGLAKAIKKAGTAEEEALLKELTTTK